MRYIEKQGLPDVLQAALDSAKQDKLSWGDFVDGKQDLRAFLTVEQEGLCAYSEVRLTEFGCHIDHIKPKGKPEYAELCFDYENLLLSAIENPKLVERKANVFGGHKKQNRYNEAFFIAPTECNCGSFFQYAPDGSMSPNDDLSDQDRTRVEDTIDTLGLNCLLLKNKRQKLYQSMMQNLKYMYDQPEALEIFLNEYFITDDSGCLHPFQSMLRQIAGQ